MAAGPQRWWSCCILTRKQCCICCCSSLFVPVKLETQSHRIKDDSCVEGWITYQLPWSRKYSQVCLEISFCGESKFLYLLTLCGGWRGHSVSATVGVGVRGQSEGVGLCFVPYESRDGASYSSTQLSAEILKSSKSTTKIHDLSDLNYFPTLKNFWHLVNQSYW